MRRRLAPVLALVLLVTLAGCLAPILGDDGSRLSDPNSTPSGADADTPTATDTPTETPRPTANVVQSGRNPWGDETAVVALDAGDRPASKFAPLVREATAYWVTNAEQYVGDDVSFRVDADASDPDVVVSWVDALPECGNGTATDAVGCAPVLTEGTRLPDPTNVYVLAGFSNESTALILKHEFGHVLGLRHDDAPADVMAASSVLYTDPKPDATERAFPWRDANFTVYVDDAGAEDSSGVRDQIGHALEYYEDGADGSVPSNLTFRLVDSREDAEILIVFPDSSACTVSPGSCAETSGSDPDGDDAIEVYDRMRISLVDLDTDAVGWHVGYWLAYGFGAEDDAEKPPPFRDASYRERRSEWWR